MSTWEIEKNRLDMDYQQYLQKYQVVYAALYSVPLSIFALLFSSNIKMELQNVFFFGAVLGFFSYVFLDNKLSAIENKLASLKSQVSKLNPSR